MIDRNDSSEVRILLTALFGMVLLIIASVGIAVSEVTASEACQDTATSLASGLCSGTAPD